MYKNFAEYSPCIYKGKIFCKECKKRTYCDMVEGREIRQRDYEAGFKQGLIDSVNICKCPVPNSMLSICQCGKAII